MRPISWVRKQTFKKINKKAAIVEYQYVPNKEKYLTQKGRLSKISVSDIIPTPKQKYNRAKAKKEFMLELMSYDVG